MNEKTILLIEDNPDDRELTRRALCQSNIANEVVIARDGVEALELLFGSSAASGGKPCPLPSVILLDLKLPRIDGLEVLRRLRADPRTRLVPVVVLTTSNEESDLIASYRNGANSYLRKPVDFSQFAKAIRHLGLYWLVMNEPPPVPRTSETVPPPPT